MVAAAATPSVHMTNPRTTSFANAKQDTRTLARTRTSCAKVDATTCDLEERFAKKFDTNLQTAAQ
jgi:hypothetical protein